MFNEMNFQKLHARFVQLSSEKPPQRYIVPDKTYLFMSFMDFLNECCVIMK